MVSYLADRAEELAHMMNQAQEEARRAWLFSGDKAYGVLWDALTPEQKKTETKRETKLKAQYDYAKKVMLNAAPSLLAMFGDDPDYTNVRILLEITLEVAGVKYKPAAPITVPAAASAQDVKSDQEAWIEALRNPIHLAVLKSPIHMNEGA